MILLSNNQWYCDYNTATWEAMGENCSAEARAPFLAKAYLSLMPDVIALQETTPRMLDLMLEHLHASKEGQVYNLVSGKDTPLFYRKDTLCLLQAGFELFPEQIPDHPGSFNNMETKSFAWGVWQNRQTGKKFIMASTHLWYMRSDPTHPKFYPFSDEARTYQLMRVIHTVEPLMQQWDCPCVIAGDMNALWGSPCLASAVEAGWQDAYYLATGERDETMGKHFCNGTGFGRGDAGTFADAIDHILVKGTDKLTVNRFCRFMPAWFDKLSDHYPLYIDVDLA